MWMEPYDQAASVLNALSITVAGGFCALFVLRARRRADAERIKTSLEKHKNYFAYLSMSLGSTDALLPPPGRLTPADLKAIQIKLLEWMETIGGEYRDQLTDLCRDLGLVELERKRLRSARHGVRLEAAYRLGMMRAAECTGELLQLLEREAGESTAFVVGRAAAKCAETLDDLRRVLLLLTEHHPEAHQLIADIAASSSLDPAPLFTELLAKEDCEAHLIVALTGLSGRNDPEVAGAVLRLIDSGYKEVRIKAAKVYLQVAHPLTPGRIGELIRHPDWEIRAAAVKAVGRLQLDAHIGVLTDCLGDAEWWVRYYSAESLSRLGPAGFEALCEAACGGENAASLDFVRETVQEELSRAKALVPQDTRQTASYDRLFFIYQRKRRGAGVNRAEVQTRGRLAERGPQ
ncbi:HEAT repeat domain-containing protein [Paenibacillus hamazuiensis]|uniref:HEAT repeat domain-containing protein n=1 Tax=Paenibacillus hamazuiensis TaxID=2936508 RepID=UPI002010C2D0|nr:HEAT repeat domain-containing protein [Paenibacillus hamazuiensis]